MKFSKLLIATFFLGFLVVSCEKKKTEDTSEKGVEKDSLTTETAMVEPTETDLIGKWVEPNPIDSTQVQGFELKKGGEASSINFETLKYEKWWVKKDTLYFTIKSIGNSQTLTDEMKFKINAFNTDELSLQNGDMTNNYRKQK